MKSEKNRRFGYSMVWKKLGMINAVKRQISKYALKVKRIFGSKGKQ